MILETALADTASRSFASACRVACDMQSAKTASLGPRRDLEALPSILTDPMLSRFQSEAAQAEETGWFWKYKVNSVQVHLALYCTYMSALQGLLLMLVHIQHVSASIIISRRFSKSFVLLLQVM